MTLTNAYCTVTQLKQAIKRPNSDEVVYDSLFEDCINRASRDIDEHTNRIFYSKTITAELFDAFAWSDSELYISDNKILFPSEIISVSSITNDGTALTEGTDFYVYKKQGYIEAAGSWSSSRKSSANSTGIAITATFGHATTPTSIEMICIELAKVYSGLDTRMITNANGTFEFEMGNKIPDYIKKRLNRYKRYGV